MVQEHMDIENLFNSDTGIVPLSRAPTAPQNERAPTADMNPLVAFSVALGLHTTDEICQRHGVSRAEYDALAASPVFMKMVESYATSLQEQGMSFRTKAAVQAEMMLDSVVWQMVQDPTTPSQTKLDAFKTIAKLAGYEPKQGPAEASGQSFRLVINLGEQGGRVIEGTPIRIGDEE